VACVFGAWVDWRLALARKMKSGMRQDRRYDDGCYHRNRQGTRRLVGLWHPHDITKEDLDGVQIPALRDCVDQLSMAISKIEAGVEHETSWKRQAMEGLSSVFSGRAEAKDAVRDGEVEKLHAKIGQLLVERDFLAKVLFGKPDSPWNQLSRPLPASLA
jgi:hypothetical protein